MIKDLIEKCRSYRGFNEDRKITKEELLDFVECARLCPSSTNTQPLKFYLSWEKDEVEKILAQTRWAAALPELDLPFDGTHPTAFIVICQDLDIDNNIPKFQKDVGFTAHAILLAAVEDGLGGLMIGNFNAGGIREVLDLPDNLSPQLVVALGEPAETVVLTEVGEDGSTKYYRDENNVHYVPKRSLEDITLTGGQDS